jgi:hypothetical protein
MKKLFKIFKEIIKFIFVVLITLSIILPIILLYLFGKLFPYKVVNNKENKNPFEFTNLVSYIAKQSRN